MNKKKILIFIISTLLLCFSICSHEFGHYITAKEFGIGVKSFNIGFGPTIYSIQKDETSYNIKPLLFGGYNVLYNNLDEENDKLSYENAKTYQKIIILSAGIIINIIIAIICLISFTFCKGIPLNNNNKEEEIPVNKSDLSFDIANYKNIQFEKTNFLSSIKFVISKIYDLIRDFIFNIKEILNPVKNHKEYGGPLSIINDMSSIIKLQKSYILLTFGILNLSLALINIIPMPPLDGGKLILLLFTEIFGYNSNIELIVNVIGCIILIIILSLSVKNDLANIIYKILKKRNQ